LAWLQLAPEVGDTSVPKRLTYRLEQAVARLKSLHDGDAGVVDVIACGKDAIPAVRLILFERERSGLFQTRCRAVEVLAALGAYDILLEYLSADHRRGDAVEQLGNDAVINAAALACAKTREERVFHLLMRLLAETTACQLRQRWPVSAEITARVEGIDHRGHCGLLEKASGPDGDCRRGPM
jgi:hypothetical protein